MPDLRGAAGCGRIMSSRGGLDNRVQPATQWRFCSEATIDYNCDLAHAGLVYLRVSSVVLHTNPHELYRS